MHGIDSACVLAHWIYHPKLDNVSNVSTVATQIDGENALEYIKYFSKMSDNVIEKNKNTSKQPVFANDHTEYFYDPLNFTNKYPTYSVSSISESHDTFIATKTRELDFREIT